MPFIELNEEDYKRLIKLAGIFEPSQAISRLLDLHEDEIDEPHETEIAPAERIIFKTSNIPNLKFAKFEYGSIDGVRPASNNWNSLMSLALKIAHDKLGGFDEVLKVANINLYEGKKEDEGYTELAGHGFSYQRQAAQYSAKCIAGICDKLDLTLQIDFRWRVRDGVENAGKKGRILRPV